MTSYKVKYRKSFQKSARGLAKTVREQLKEEIPHLVVDPYSGKKLKGDLSGEFSWRFSDYRIIYQIVDTPEPTVDLLLVSHRRNVYQLLRRLLLLLLSL